ncbi:MAG: triphosphoribosyl-dephospho-CoA synthase CitG [Enterococcaceae bacterium]|nr:triphosphoribosyl-dephospho-CoA synthase CitG [Enterococcaceae bacterium]MCI1920194.1 triphosphoribosyl-dephospho-CoA synthase CitG [Enterococcaceae bacterium]
MVNPLIQTIAAYAQKALLYEVTLTPKPGLVDRETNGAHDDMDFFTFIDSIVGLAPFLPQYAEAGFMHRGSEEALFKKIRCIGAAAEKAMMRATNGINTHKGANFSFAILLAATARFLQKQPTLPLEAADSEQIFQIAAQMTQHLLEEDFADLHLKKKLTYGEQLYLEKGLTGIRGEASKGYPALRELLLPHLRALPHEDPETRLLRTLVLSMSEVEDGNLLHRGDVAGWRKVQEETKKIHQADLSKEKLLDELKRYDQRLIRRHLSPGGSADLLALAIYFAFLEGIF